MLYCDSKKSSRWIIQMFACTVDVSLTDDALIYMWHCKAVVVDAMSLKIFRNQVFLDSNNQNPLVLLLKELSIFR